MSIQTINPATGEPIRSYEAMTWNEVETMIDDVSLAQIKWMQSSFKEKVEPFKRVVSLLQQNLHQYATIITQEMGKPITAAIDEVKKCGWVCEYYLEHAEKLLAPKDIQTTFKKSYVCYQPLGIVFAIMPWNYPFWQVFRFAMPTLFAGNGIVLKHAPISSGASMAMESLFRAAGFPEHLFRSVFIHHDIAGLDLIHLFN